MRNLALHIISVLYTSILTFGLYDLSHNMDTLQQELDNIYCTKPQHLNRRIRLAYMRLLTVNNI
jgi:hypothetical protein